MSPFVLHAAKTLAYLGCAGGGAALGRAGANFLLSGLPMPAEAFFIVICILAGLLIGFMGPLEERLFWGRWFTPSEEDLRWLGRPSSSLLTGSIPCPGTLGFVLGMLSLLVA